MEDQNMELQNLKKTKKIYSILDSAYIDKITLKLIKQGQKKQVFNILHNLVQSLKETSTTSNNITATSLLNTAINNVMPFVQLKSLKKGSTSIQIPTTLTQKQQLNLAIKWLVIGANKRNDHKFTVKFLKELQDASKKQGQAIQLKMDQHKTALNQKRFLYFRK